MCSSPLLSPAFLEEQVSLFLYFCDWRSRVCQESTLVKLLVTFQGYRSCWQKISSSDLRSKASIAGWKYHHISGCYVNSTPLKGTCRSQQCGVWRLRGSDDPNKSVAPAHLCQKVSRQQEGSRIDRLQNWNKVNPFRD